MNVNEIEILKGALSQMVMKGCTVKNDTYKVEGKVVGIGFKPYWSNPYDSKIEKLELNILNRYGRIIPFVFNNIIGYDILSHDGASINDSKNISLDIHVFSNRRDLNEPYEKIKVDISTSAF
ncbi:MAG TPA: hypothetical protein VF941_18335 [Clostridia bacterium]